MQNRGVIKKRVPIDQRPDIGQNRERLGDIEADLMMGKITISFTGHNWQNHASYHYGLPPSKRS